MIKLFFLSILTVILSGCVHLEEYIQINKNGSAKLVMTYSIPKEGLTLLKDAELVLNELNNKKVETDIPRIFDREKLTAYFKKFKSVDIISVRVNEEDGRLVTYINLFIDDFRQTLRDGMLPYTTLEKDGDDYVFAARYPFNLSKLKEKPQLKKVLDQIKVNFKVKTPTEITKTNAPKKLANLVEWDFNSKSAPFTKSDGRFVVHFNGKNLTFLDDKKEK